MLTDAEIAAINKVTRGSAMRRDGTTTERIYRAGYAAGAAAQRERDADMLRLTRSQAQLMAGEMTAGEWRTVSAVLTNRAALIRNAAPTRGEGE